MRSPLFRFASPVLFPPRYNKHVGHSEVKEVGCGLKHTLLLLESGTMLSCGSNEKGQLGQDSVVTSSGVVLGANIGFLSRKP